MYSSSIARKVSHAPSVRDASITRRMLFNIMPRVAEARESGLVPFICPKAICAYYTSAARRNMPTVDLYLSIMWVSGRT
jgi:hypothetical protein